MEKENLIQAAKAILYKNKKGDYTLPTETLYPFQWNWDSGFVSIGFSRFDLKAAISEIKSLLSGQWENGMIPHIIFHSETEETYFPNWDFWNAELNEGAPAHPKTSGITQPPVLAFVLEWILKAYPNDAWVRNEIKEMYPAIERSLNFWYNHRDPYDEGLVFIYHPWESGRDNSPLWDEAMNRIDLNSLEIPEYTRRDIKVADASERPTHKQYDQYVFLMQLGKKYRYEDAGIVEESEFLMQDTLINAMLIRSNEALIYLGQAFGHDISYVKQRQQKSIKNYRSKLWNESLGCFTVFDLKASKQLEYWEIGGLTSMFAGVASDTQAQRQHDYLQQLAHDNYLIAPSFDVHHEWYDSKRYWRGPIWPQMNWLLFHGMRRYQYDDLANILRADFIELVEKFGFYEYFEAQRDQIDKTHGGYGGRDFSWTASTVIDFLMTS